MYGARTIKVCTLGIEEGRCKYCRDRILWATTASAPGKPARTLPFTWPRPWPISAERNDETGLDFEVWPREKLHFTTCARQPARTKKTTSGRAVAGRGESA